MSDLQMDATDTITTSHGHAPSDQAWRAVAEIPKSEDIVSDFEPLIPEHHDFPLSKEQYLEREYYKLRYEAIQPLREALRAYQYDPDERENDAAYIYSNLNEGAAFRMSFIPYSEDEDITWAESSRLKTGSIVLLSPATDRFESICLVAVVAYRYLCGGLEPDLEAGEPVDTPPRIDLFFHEWNNDFMDPSVQYVMIEGQSGYFESVRYAMVGLQLAASEGSRLDNYVLGQETIVENSSLVNEFSSSTATSSSLDASQLEALEHIATRQLSIIQGPPGTGKTFTIIAAVQQLVSATDAAPIVVAAQTNHAVDQLLRRCAELGITRIVRLGSRCSKDIDKFRIFALRETSKYMSTPSINQVTRCARRDVNNSRAALREILQPLAKGLSNINADVLLKHDIISTKQFESLHNTEWDTDEKDGLAAWLNGQIPCTASRKVRTQPRATHEEKQQTEVDPGKPRGEYVSLEPAARQKGSWSAAHQLSSTTDLYRIKPRRREDVYHLMCQRLAEKFMQQAEGRFHQYNRDCTILASGKRLRDAALIRAEGIQILGCTVTGLSRYRTLMKDLAPKIILIDEASEAFEATITASALLPSVEQLALVGDHQQLTPRPATSLMQQQPFSLNISLFERLINQVDYKMLLCQRRMVPNIRDIISDYYPKISDHISVTERKLAFPGDRNLWWFDHKWPESRTPKKSCYNSTEADMVVRFANHLIEEGVPAERITVLTCYTAQEEVISKMLLSDEFVDARQVAVRTVDGFQGCESGVIILSLVRSNKPGFIADIHRATVALSRARDAMFVFGNATALLQNDAESQETWTCILQRFQKQGAIGPRLRRTSGWDEVISQFSQRGKEIQGDANFHDFQEAAEDASEKPLLCTGQEPQDLPSIDNVLAKYDSEYIMNMGYSSCFLPPFVQPLKSVELVGGNQDKGILIELEDVKEVRAEDLIIFD